MKTTLLVTTIFLSISIKVFSQTQISTRDTLKIYAGNFSSDTGCAVAMLFRKEDGLPRDPFMKVTGVIQNGKSILVFADIPFGEYAAIVFHDENSNGILDHSWLGLPKEPKGFSSGWELTIFSGIPSFSKLKFEFSKQKPDCTIDIK